MVDADSAEERGAEVVEVVDMTHNQVEMCLRCGSIMSLQNNITLSTLKLTSSRKPFIIAGISLNSITFAILLRPHWLHKHVTTVRFASLGYFIGQ